MDGQICGLLVQKTQSESSILNVCTRTFHCFTLAFSVVDVVLESREIEYHVTVLVNCEMI